jgi:3-deoxy-D-manno-octulosonic-acid transferase
VAGSTWPEDEKALLDGLDSLLRAGRCQMILVPHEPTKDHLAALSSSLQSKGIDFSLYSSGRWTTEPVLIVDQVGILAELYAWGDIAFVGGSFKGSVHSVMEPLGAHLLTLVGPHFSNNREAMEFSKIPVGPFMAVQKCSDADSLNRTVSLLIDHGKQDRKMAIEKAFNERLGASRRIYDTLFSGTAQAGPSGDHGLSLRY